MVSGSLCPLFSFLDLSDSVRFEVRGKLPRRGLWPMALPHREIFSEPARRASELARRASKQARGSSEEAAMLGDPQIKLGEPWGSWEGLKATWESPAASWEILKARWEAPGGGGGQTETKKKTVKISLYSDASGIILWYEEFIWGWNSILQILNVKPICDIYRCSLLSVPHPYTLRPYVN